MYHSVQQRLRFPIRVECPAGGGVDQRLTSHYWHEDGTEQELLYEGRMQVSRLEPVDGRLNGSIWSAWQDMGGALRGTPALLPWIGGPGSTTVPIDLTAQTTALPRGLPDFRSQRIVVSR